MAGENLVTEGGDNLVTEGGTSLSLEGDVSGLVAAPSPLGPPELLASQSQGYVEAVTPLGAPAMHIGFSGLLEVTPGPLGAPAATGFHDFTSLLDGTEVSYYHLDLETPGGTVRVPMSSWQATLQVGRSSYVQAVIPNAGAYISDITAATTFSIKRRITYNGGTVEHEMASAPVEEIPQSQGATNNTVSMSGYTTAFAEDLSPPVLYDRNLDNIRTKSTSTAGLRVRCDIDWLLRPAQRAYAGADELIVAYINYYVTGTDAYMDVGERSG